MLLSRRNKKRFWRDISLFIASGLIGLTILNNHQKIGEYSVDLLFLGLISSTVANLSIGSIVAYKFLHAYFANHYLANVEPDFRQITLDNKVTPKLPFHCLWSMTTEDVEQILASDQQRDFIYLFELPRD